MLEFLALAQRCAPTVAPQTMAAIVNVESGFDSYAIGIVGGRLARQPASHAEAVATAKALATDGWNFSVGIAQVNRYNLPKYAINYETAFDTCTNLRVGSKILEDCFVRASKNLSDRQSALRAAISCYYSGNLIRGFKPDITGRPSYLQKVIASADELAQSIEVVPAINGAVARPQATPMMPGPVRLKVSTTTPGDNAPVLLRQDDAAAVQIRPRTTSENVSGPLSGTDSVESDKTPTLPAHSVIVF